MTQSLLFTNSVTQAIDDWAKASKPTKIFVVADSNTARLVVPQLSTECNAIATAQIIVVNAGEENKSIDSLASIWKSMSFGGGTRSCAVINVGGGVITDMGGFAAATFKRGVRFINIPTTLLAAVDAAVGGKTGIDFHGLKNEIGVFSPAEQVIISTRFFSTLPDEEILSGYAEMVKHGLLKDNDAMMRLIAVNPLELPQDKLLELVKESVLIKKGIVDIDPHEKGLRKALNLGHTPGHALESHALDSGHPVPHGFAVAWGLVIDLVLSHLQLGFPSSTLTAVASFVRDNYPAPAITCDDYPTIIEYMRHDKKNRGDGTIAFTLLKAPGNVDTNCIAEPTQIKTALDIFRDLLSI